MKFKILVKCIDDDEVWEELYDKQTEDPVEWANNTIEWFNETLRPGEKRRELVDVIIMKQENLAHEWEKQTDGMSVNFRGQRVDLMRCRRCGITGKRYGLSSNVKIDSKYRKKVFNYCDTAIEELKKQSR